MTVKDLHRQLRARTDATPLLTLAEALLALDGKPPLDEAERLVRATIIDSLAERCPEAEAAFQAWAESDDFSDNGTAAIVAAVLGAEKKRAAEQEGRG
jgi:hypothetical protein